MSICVNCIVFGRYDCFLVIARFRGKRYIGDLASGSSFKAVGAVGLTHTGFEIAAAMLTSPSVHSRDTYRKRFLNALPFRGISLLSLVPAAPTVRALRVEAYGFSAYSAFH